MSFDLESLGITKGELQERIVDRAVERLFDVTGMDEEGDEFVARSPLAGRLEAAVKQAIDTKVSALAEAHVLPLAESFIENLTLQSTNEWGEKRGKPVTFIEYLIQRAESYLREEVDFNGASKAESRDSYGWKKSQTRVSHLVHQHLHYSIDRAMKEAIANANQAIVGGIEGAVKIKLAEVANSLKVEVKTK